MPTPPVKRGQTPSLNYLIVWLSSRSSVEFGVPFILICQMGRVFADGPGDRGLNPGRIIPKTPKMVLDNFLLSTQHYKVLSRISGVILGMV